MIVCAGHVIYEMACRGRELTSAVPDAKDYRWVEDERVTPLLERIFSECEKEETDYRGSVTNVSCYLFVCLYVRTFV